MTRMCSRSGCQGLFSVHIANMGPIPLPINRRENLTTFTIFGGSIATFAEPTPSSLDDVQAVYQNSSGRNLRDERPCHGAHPLPSACPGESHVWASKPNTKAPTLRGAGEHRLKPVDDHARRHFLHAHVLVRALRQFS